jgi:predicted Rossmann fold flavoprotein
LANGDSGIFDRVLLATGSAPQGHAWARALGHTIEAAVPSLFTLNVPDERLKKLPGISVEKGRIKLLGTNFEQTGPILITHWGFSGPAVLKLSAWAARALHEMDYHAQVELNWTGRIAAAVREEFVALKKSHPKKLVSASSPAGLPHRLWERIVRTAELPLGQIWAHLSTDQMDRLLECAVADVYAIRGKTTFKEEFVTCGGVKLDEVDFRTMESRKCPGLYFAGEVLDVDGVTGGFNFQNAWTTGWLAGQAIGKA